VYTYYMPNVSTYIKSADLAKYLAIQSQGKGAWTEFVHKALNGTVARQSASEPTTKEDSNVDNRDNTRDNTNPTTTSGVLRTPEQKQKLDSYFRRPKQQEEWSGPITKADSARKRK